jgi:imidazolonepropionase-like amidohydrolase
MPDPRFYDYVLADGAALDQKLIALRNDTRSYVLHGGRVLDGRGDRQPATVVIRGERIAELLPSDARVDDTAATTIDCTGKTILPGLMDLHVHMMGTLEHDRFLSHLSPTAGVRTLRIAFEAYQLLAHGFTTVLNLGHGDADDVFGLREAIAEGIVRGPRTLHVGWYLAPSHVSETWLPRELASELRISMHVAADGEAEIRSVIRGNAADGAEWTKLYFAQDVRPSEPWYTAEELRVIVDQSHALGLRVACHAKTVAALRAAVEAGVDCVEHGPDEVDPPLLELMAARGIFLVPTLAVYQRVLDVGGEFGYAPAMVDRIRRELEGRMRNVAAAREAGVRIGVGSDVGARAGFGYLGARELELLCECGFTPMEAITAATSTSADILGLGHELGSIRPGKLADLLVVDGDPLADITLFQRPAAIKLIFQAPA